MFGARSERTQRGIYSHHQITSNGLQYLEESMLSGRSFEIKRVDLSWVGKVSQYAQQLFGTSTC